MNKYLIELFNVPHEIAMYVEELKLYGEITRYSEVLPLFLWIDSLWDKDILETVSGIKKIWIKRFDSIPLSVSHGRNWTELEGTKWEK